ncbi:MAG TPA: hypothetical protein VGO11_16155 [Chthoniobacteraceae bacterium]|jgi:hypothetical protein|nr:hypothetical protein [Chthoniobacteraceae bacterium]
MISPNPKAPAAPQLHGRTIFLSASVPSAERSARYHRIEDAGVTIDEAVVVLARAVFAGHGTLVFGAHPSISPLIASVLREYAVPEEKDGERSASIPTGEQAPSRPQVIMYQSEVWRPLWAENSRRLAAHSLVQVRWTPVVAGETVSSEVRGIPQAPGSMAKMREQMVEETRPVAMVAIGGMEGTEEEAEIFARLRPGAPIYPLSATGGAAGRLGERGMVGQSRVFSLDKEAHNDVRAFWSAQEGEDPRHGNASGEGSAPRDVRRERYYIPLAAIGQRIVSEIAERSRDGI